MTKIKLSKKDREAFRKAGAKGGSAKVPKGFAAMSPERLKKVSAKGGKAKAKKP